MRFRNAFGGSLAFAALIFALAASPQLLDAAQEHEGQAAALEETISVLRAEGDYEGALEAAEELLRLLADDAATTPYDLDTVGRDVETLRHISSLPEDDRSELARADSLSIEIWGVSAEGRYAEAAELAARRLEIQRRILGDTHTDIALSLDELATLLQYSGDLDSPEPLFREALEIRSAVLGERHAEVGGSKNNLAILLQAKGDLAGAELLLRDAVGIFDEEFGADDPLVATLTNNLGMLLYSMGNLDAAEPLYRKALATRQQQLGDRHPEVANSLTNLAVLLHARGDYAAAEPFLREATAVWREVLGNEHPHVGISLNNVASLVSAQGEYAEAEALHREALEIAQIGLGDSHPEIARILNNLARTLEHRGDYAAAEPLFRRALEINREASGEEHPETAANMNNLAHFLQARGDVDGAEALYREALAIRKRTLGDNHLETARSLSNLASLLEARGDYDDALPLYEGALEIRRTQLGSASPAIAHSLSSIGFLHYVMGDPAGAEPYLEEALEVHDAAVARAGEGLKRATAALRLRPPACVLAAALLAQGKPEEAWPPAERAQARALADLLMTAGQRQLTEREVAREESLGGAIAALEGQIAAYHAAAETDTIKDAGALLDEARGALLSAEAEWSAFRREIGTRYPVSEGRPYSLERVQAALPDRAAIVGWVEVEAGPDRRDVWTYTIRSEGPVVWGSCEEAAGPQPQELRPELADPGSSSIGLTRDAASVYRTWFQPIEDALEGIDELVVIPSGQMLGVPVEALVDGGRSTLGETYSVSYAPSATVFTWLTERSAQRASGISEMLLLGDPPFTQAHADVMNDEAAPVGAERAVGAGQSFPRLPASRAEVLQLAELSAKSTVLLGPESSEEALVQLARSGRLENFDCVHLATHAVVDDEQPGRSSLVLSQVGLPDPLKSALAGTRIYDGFLSADEIVREWTLDADLVTLSACETGLGRRVVGEGYIGFAHAFFQVGARSLLVGLWKVDDEATSLLMRRFYENWTGVYEGDRAGHEGKPMGKADALREAKLWLRNYDDGRGGHPFRHPCYWASFILMGGRG